MPDSLTLALRTAQSGLLANQKALGAVSNNVANVNTEGYSRQIVKLEQRVLAGNGAGVQLAALTRRIDESLMKSVRSESGALNAIRVQQTFFQRTQQLFGAPGDDASLSHTLNRFTQALESLSVTPHGALEQRELVRAADDVAIQFRQMSASIQDLRLDADRRIGQALSEVNGLLDQVADLNQKIVRNGTIGHGVGDLEDQRDQALDRLSQLIDTQVFNRGNGDTVIFTSGGRILVDGGVRPLSHHPAAAISATFTHASGDISGIYSGDKLPANDLTTEIRSGELKGLIEMRDGILPNFQETLNVLAGELRTTVNEIHNRGVGFPGLREMSGSHTFTDPSSETLGITGDVAIVLFDGTGAAVAQAHLSDLVALAPPPTVETVKDALDGWISTHGGGGSSVFFDSNNRLQIKVGSPDHSLAFRDEVGGGDNTAVTAGTGFSSFFGLNDFFVAAENDNMVAGTLAVRADIKAKPSLVARGVVQTEVTGAGPHYFASIGDGTLSHRLATALSAPQSFAHAGNLGSLSVTFSQYAAEIISDNASRTEANDSAASFQTGLVDNLKAKSDSVRGVNLDEEMSDLILYEQAYAAAARLIGVVQTMFEALERAVR